MRDFYDVCYLNSIYKEQIKKDVLKEALFRTSEKRKHQNVFNNYCVILQKITDSSELKKYGRIIVYDMFMLEIWTIKKLSLLLSNWLKK